MSSEQKDAFPQAKVSGIPCPVEEKAEENLCRQVLERLEIEAPEILSALPKE